MAATGGTTNTDTCKRELIIEVPADAVHREAERAAQAFQRKARIPGFRPGKTPTSLVRQRFKDEIREEVLRNLASDYFRRRAEEEKLQPVNTPAIEDVHLDLEGNEPMRFKAVFEVLPSFELKDYTGLEVEEAEAAVSDQEVEDALKQIQQEQATYAAVEDRPLQDGDFAAIAFEGKPTAQAGAGNEPEAEAAGEKKPQPAAAAGTGPGGGRAGETVKMDDVLCEIGGADTLPAFTENLRGMAPGEEKSFPVSYPKEFSDQRLAGRTLAYTVRVNAVKQKQVPEMNDEFARDLGSFTTLDEVRADIRQKLLEQKRRQAEHEAKEKLLSRLIELHDFPVPESLVEKQVQTRMERTMRQLGARGLNPSRLDLDWARIRQSHREAAVRDVKTDLILNQIAEREGIEATAEEITRETEQLVRQVQSKDPAAVRARLTRQAAADTIKHRLRSDKTLDFVYRKANKLASRAGTEVRS